MHAAISDVAAFTLLLMKAVVTGFQIFNLHANVMCQKRLFSMLTLPMSGLPSFFFFLFFSAANLKASNNYSSVVARSVFLSRRTECTLRDLLRSPYLPHGLQASP